MGYNLYLDESKFKYRDQIGYCVAGVIIEEGSQLHSVRKYLGRVKSSIWSDKYGFGKSKQIIFHEAEIRSHASNIIRRRAEYESFKKAENVRLAVRGIGNIIENHSLPVMGVLENQTEIAETYKTSRNSYTSYYLSLKQIIENYCYFLKNNNSTGEIVLESRKNKDSSILDQRVRKMFMKIMAHGTLRYSSMDLQKSISGIAFVQKQENEAGLQIADFVPHPFLLHYFGVSQTKPSIYQQLRKARYDGEMGPKKGASRLGIFIFD